jgi:maltose-binding protein MalE
MIQKKLSRREFLRLASTAAAAGFLAACAPASSPGGVGEEEPGGVAPPPEGSLVRLWSSWGGAGFLAAWEDIQASDEWSDVIGNNTFELKDAIGGEAMLTAIAGGDPPEGGCNIQYLDFMAREALVPIDSWVAASNIVKRESFISGNWDQCYYQGKMYGVPAIEGFVRFALNYNAEIVAEAGLDPDKPPVTWMDTLDWHEKLTRFDAAGNVERIGLNPYGAMGEGFWYSDGWMVPTSWGWEWFDAGTGEFDLDNEKMTDAFATLKQFIDTVGVDNLAAMYSVEGRDTWGGAYNAKVESMIIEGYWHPGETANEAPEVAEHNRATWLPVPENRRGVTVQGAAGHMVVFFKGSKNPEGLFKVAEYMQSTVACDAFFNHLGWLPSVTSYYDTVDATKYPGLDFYFKSAVEAAEIYEPARCEITEFASNEFLALKDQVNRDMMTAAQAAAELQRRCEDEYRAAGFKS